MLHMPRDKDRRNLPIRRCLLNMLSAAALLLALQTAILAQEESPATIYDPTVEYPLFVSAKLAETQDTLDPALFEPIGMSRMNAIFDATPVHGCYPVEPIIYDLYEARNPPTSLTEAAQTYPVIAFGTVKELTPGFEVGEAGFLVRVEAREGSRQIDVGKDFFAFIPVGAFTFRGKRVCKEDPRFAGLPKVGDEVLLFTDPPGNASVDLLLIEYPRNLVLISGEEVRYSPHLVTWLKQGASLPATRTELLRGLARAFASESE